VQQFLELSAAFTMKIREVKAYIHVPNLHVCMSLSGINIQAVLYPFTARKMSIIAFEGKDGEEDKYNYGTYNRVDT
jgi:hypothetical protein